MMIDMERHNEIVSDFQSKYEREVVQHGDDLKNLELMRDKVRR